jgi:hypothetical protein
VQAQWDAQGLDDDDAEDCEVEAACGHVLSPALWRALVSGL